MFKNKCNIYAFASNTDFFSSENFYSETFTVIDKNLPHFDH